MQANSVGPYHFFSSGITTFTRLCSDCVERFATMAALQFRSRSGIQQIGGHEPVEQRRAIGKQLNGRALRTQRSVEKVDGRMTTEKQGLHGKRTVTIKINLYKLQAPRVTCEL